MKSPTTSITITDSPDQIYDGAPETLDHAVSFRAYESNQDTLIAIIKSLSTPTRLEPRVVDDPEHTLLVTPEEINAVWGIYPDGAQGRALPARIVSEPPVWFSRQLAANGLPQLAKDPAEAISPTSFALGSVSWDLDPDESGYRPTIHLYELPDSCGFSVEVRHIAQLKALVHEIAHTILTPELLVSNISLKLSDGNQAELDDFFDEFAEVTQKYPPISNYSAAYRTSDGSFVAKDSESLRIATEEELAESITAYLLGFTVNVTGQLTFEPFAGKDDLEKLVASYLAAERTIKASRIRIKKST